MKLKQKELAQHRLTQLKSQRGMCPICERTIKPSEAVLDHDHTTGHTRMVLHRECNSLEGKIANWFRTFGKDVDLQVFLSNVYEYMHSDWTENPIHPTHLTDNDKKIRMLRRRLRNAKKESTKDRIKTQIKLLQQEEVQ